jgi:hypothetical protein
MYQYPQYPPMLFPPPNGRDEEIMKRAMEVAVRLTERKEREKERADKIKKRTQKEEEKLAAARSARRLLFVETYVLGIVSYPIWAPLMKALIHYLEHLQ